MEKKAFYPPLIVELSRQKGGNYPLQREITTNFGVLYGTSDSHLFWRVNTTKIFAVYFWSLWVCNRWSKLNTKGWYMYV